MACTFGQNLMDIYKSGTVYLKPLSEYGQENNWNEIFSGYYDKSGNQQVGDEKKIIVSDAGEVFMSHKNHYQIWRFDKDGKLVGKYGEKGGKPYQFAMLPSIETIVADKYYLTTDINGRLKLFTLDGEYYKSIKMDIMPRSIFARGNFHALYVGSVLWSTQWRYLVVDLNLETGKYDIVYSRFYPKGEFKLRKEVVDGDTIRFGYSTFGQGSISIPGNVYVNRPHIAFTRNGNFVAAEPTEQAAKFFSSDGKLINEFNFDIEPISITDKDVEQRYNAVSAMFEETIERVRKNDWTEARKEKWLEMYREYIEELKEVYKDRDNYLPTLPYFSKIFFDSDDNMLVFEFTRKEDIIDNKFSVIAYSSDGKRIAEASLVSEDYDLTITEETIVFHKGYLYAVCKKKNEEGIPLRLVKFRLSTTK